ncbi:MAG: 1-acyl-sn-glycerol-3-phosphate acyltransferase [Candidatus Geothermincolia bacterium]
MAEGKGSTAQRYMDDRDKERVIVEVTHRVMDSTAHDPRKVEKALFDTLYEERQRLKTEKDKKEVKRLSGYYKKLQQESAKGSPERQRELLQELINHYTMEVSGHFDRRVYAAATSVIPALVTGLLNTMTPLKLIQGLPRGFETLEDQMVLQGETELFRDLVNKGTVVLVATHSSHMDSIMLGWAIYRMGLPPFAYGAGLNLFSNPILGYFMHNLGAYKVDRRKKAELYKDVLKAYCGCTIEMGYNNMFFPGGTRTRSGATEDKLKMGLLGQGLDAYIHNLRNKKDNPDVFVVPVTINYQLVLEAETLIDDYLKEVGKSRYIITDDEFSKPRVVLNFVRKLFSLDSKIHVTVGRPLDVFGNAVDDDGNSIDHRGRVIDRRRYVYRNGRPAFDKQRDMEYTVELANGITDTFHRDTVVKSTNLVSSSVFSWLREANPGVDLYKLLRAGGEEPDVPLPEVYRRMEVLLAKLKRLSDHGHIRLDKTLSRGDTVLVMGEALAHFQSFHQQAAMTRHGDRLYHCDRNLIYYYRNRLTGFGLKEVEVGP